MKHVEIVGILPATAVINDIHYGPMNDALMGIYYLVCHAFMENPQ
ncbi:MAG: hypothetical protein ACLQU3_12425 [Limisphaerales bacterium]